MTVHPDKTMVSPTFGLANERSSLRYSSDAFALVGRVLLAAIFVFFGAGKAADPTGTIGYIGSVGLPFPPLAYAGAVALEIGGGLALLIGYRTRSIALALALFSVLAALTFHANLADQNQLIHFFKNIAMAGGLLQVAAFGSGRFSLDARRA
jgi:putative oxidoreductase